MNRCSDFDDLPPFANDPPRPPILAPFVILRDTREKDGWYFRGLTAGADDGHAPLEVETRLASLDAGDYTLLGHEDQIRIERKSPEDLLGTLTRGRDRFERELERLARFSFSAVVVEGEFRDLVTNPPARMTARAFAGSVIALSMRYPSRWYFAGSRSFAEGLAYRVFERWWRDRAVESTKEARHAKRN